MRDAGIRLIVGQLAAAKRISFQLGGGTLPAKEALTSLQNRRRLEAFNSKKRQHRLSFPDFSAIECIRRIDIN